MASKRLQRRKTERRERVKQLTKKCRNPGCRKVVCETESQAWSLAREQHRRFGGVPPKRVYECPEPDSGIWHWTSWESYSENPLYSEEYWTVP